MGLVTGEGFAGKGKKFNPGSLVLQEIFGVLGHGEVWILFNYSPINFFQEPCGKSEVPGGDTGGVYSVENMLFSHGGKHDLNFTVWNRCGG